MFQNSFVFPASIRRCNATRLVYAAALSAALILPASAEQRAIQSRVAPIYPDIAKRMRITGTVTVEATVNAEGKVVAAKTTAGNRTLGTAAEEAVSKWKFAPGAATSTVEVELTFGGV